MEVNQKKYPVKVPVPKLFVELPKESGCSRNFVIPKSNTVNNKFNALEFLENDQKKELEDFQFKYADEINAKQVAFLKEYLSCDNKTQAQQEKEIKLINKVIDTHKDEKRELTHLHRKHQNALLQTIRMLQTTRPILECPVCLEDMAPPVKIFHCPNGHLVCGSCRSNMSICYYCRMDFMGRAIGMEQYLRAIQLEEVEYKRQ